MTEPTEKKYWLDDRRNVDLVHWTLVVICGLLAFADFFYEKDVHFSFERSYAAIGFVSYVGLVLVAKQLRKILKRDESFYD